MYLYLHILIFIYVYIQTYIISCISRPWKMLCSRSKFAGRREKKKAWEPSAKKQLGKEAQLLGSPTNLQFKSRIAKFFMISIQIHSNPRILLIIVYHSIWDIHRTIRKRPRKNLRRSPSIGHPTLFHFRRFIER